MLTRVPAGNGSIPSGNNGHDQSGVADALQSLTGVKIRTNHDSINGEEGIPKRYFKDGVVLLVE